MKKLYLTHELVMKFHQVDCFNINMKFFKFLAIWPGNNPCRYYNYYSKAFIMVFVIIFYLLFSINFYFLPRQLDIFIEEMIFYFTDLAVTSKVLTFVFMHDQIIEILDILESDLFQPDEVEGLTILEKAKKFNKSYWKIIMSVSYLSSLVHIMSPLISHLVLGVELLLPVCRYAFISEEYRLMFIYPIYLYQSASIHFHMLYNVNVDSFFLGLMVLAIAQLDILDTKLRKVTDENKIEDIDGEVSRSPADRNKEDVIKMNQCIIHFIKVCRFCELVKDVFSATLFVQFGAASCIICVCLLRFTMPAPMGYYIFLGTYMSVMILQIMAPCWLGTRIMVKSQLLAFSVYNCDWTSRSREFKSNMRFFVDRANKPLSITGGKMFKLSLNTFTSIINSAYSFFTLLQHFQKEK